MGGSIPISVSVCVSSTDPPPTPNTPYIIFSLWHILSLTLHILIYHHQFASRLARRVYILSLTIPNTRSNLSSIRFAFVVGQDVIEKLRGHDDKIRCILNKADQARLSLLCVPMRVACFVKLRCMSEGERCAASQRQYLTNPSNSRIVTSINQQRKPIKTNQH